MPGVEGVEGVLDPLLDFQLLDRFVDGKSIEKRYDLAVLRLNLWKD